MEQGVGRVWVVLLEVVCPLGTSPSVETVEALLRRLADRYPSALHSPERCAVQFLVGADTAELALAAGVGVWEPAAVAAGLPSCELVRAEVKTPAELAAEYDEDPDAQVDAPHVPADAQATAAAYEFSRRLLRSRTPRQVVSALLALIGHLGGVIVPPCSYDPRIVDVDLSIAEGPPIAAAAEPFSVARLCLEEILPTAVEDARRMIRLLRSAEASPLTAVDVDSVEVD